MVKKVFKLWHDHTTGFVRVLFLLSIPAVIFQEFRWPYSYCLLILWLIVHTGYSKKWEEEGEGNEK